MSNSRAFIIEPARVDVSPAGDWGQLVELYYPNERRPSMWSSDYVADVIDRLRRHGYSPRHDYIVISGPAAMLVMVTTALVALYAECPVKALYYDHASRSYVERYLGCSPRVRTVLTENEEAVQ